ncbi:MAG: Histone deacetylase domain protein [Gemmatimonadetes bacterium]|nr:Histone deacetylase domain protein [Gemmatimonadota bacterium]
MRAWTTARFTVPLPAGHRFPIAKYAMIRDAVVARGIVAPGAVHEPERADWSSLGLVHTPRYLDAMRDGTLAPAETRRLGFPWSPELLERSRRTAQGTLEAACDALDHGAGASLAGGTHHAHPDHGEGYCCFNDVAVAIRVLQRLGRIERAVVVDLDVHQGNGTASVFAGDPSVFTFSMHGARNYPFRKADSTLDVELEDRTGDAEYLTLLDRHLGEVLATAAADLVFYLAGADPYRGDRLGRLALSVEGLQRRDRAVLGACRARGLPVAMVMAGGYAENLGDLVTIQVNSVAELRRSHG